MSALTHPKRSRKALSALRRARARKASAGAVMFIVVVTLGLLAAMGVYGLTAASADIKSAGNMRDAVQAQKAGEEAIVLTAETFNPGAAQALVMKMAGDGRTTNCKTATPYAGTVPVPAASQCIRLSEAEMKVVALAGSNPWALNNAAFAADAFGPLQGTAATRAAYTQVEITDPVDIPPPEGSGYDATKQRFTQVTATVFVDIKDAAGIASKSVVVSRGRITVGPISGAAPKYGP